MFLGNNYYQDRLKSAEDTLIQQYEKRITDIKQQHTKERMETDSLFDILNDRNIHLKNLLRIDSIQGAKKPRTYEELHNKDLENKMIEVFKERN